MKDGMIIPDDENGKVFGFTSDKFRADASWLWKEGNAVILSMIWATESNKGYAQNLIESIHKKGYDVKVPTPLGAMNRIIQKMGMVRKDEGIGLGRCEVWVLKAVKK